MLDAEVHRDTRGGAGLSRDLLSADEAIGKSAQRKASLRLLPVIGVGYGLAFMDRINISFASLQMNRDLHFQRVGIRVWRGTLFYWVCACAVPSIA